jgi:hypothetical protein
MNHPAVLTQNPVDLLFVDQELVTKAQTCPDAPIPKRWMLRNQLVDPCD